MKQDGKTLTEVIEELEGGDLMADIEKAWTKVRRAVMETGKPGSIKLTIAIAQASRRTVKVVGSVSAKEPEHARESTTFFVGEDGELFRDDPAQHQLPLKVVRMPDGDLRKVDAAE